MYYVIHDWMSKELGLKGIEKELYAIILGFCQDGESKYYGSLQYLEDVTGYSRRAIITALNNLVDKNIITKEEISGSTNRYMVTRAEFAPVQNLHTPRAESAPYNIDNNKIYSSTKNTSKKKNLYEKCIDVINENFVDEDIKNSLVDYLSVRIRTVGLSARSFKTIVLEINDLADTKEQALAIIKNATCKSYAKFYPLPIAYGKKNVYHDNIAKDIMDDEDKLREKYLEEFAMVDKSERPKFEEWRKLNGMV